METALQYRIMQNRRPLATLTLATLLSACAAHRHPAPIPIADPGKTRFESYCAACHLSGGAGGMGEAPPLEGSPWVTGPEHRLIRIVLHGLRGPIEIRGKTYNQEMPAFGQVLADAEIASLVSYVRRQFGGVAAPISPAAVTQVRATTPNRTTYWSVEELLGDPFRPSPNSWPISTTLPPRK
jgi:mono/diheme cytochrome c family protein